MRRFFWNEINEGTVRIDGQEARHIARVLRMQPGDFLVLFDGSGYDYTAKLTQTDGEYVTAEVVGKKRSESEPDVEVCVCQAIIKNDHFDYAVQKCTELGAGAVLPFLSERCVKRPKSAEGFAAREQRIAAEAAKQCGRSRIPRVLPVAEFEELAEQLRGKFVVFAYENEKTRTLKQLLQSVTKEREIYIVVGPEGGFSAQEAKTLERAGAHSVSLGKRILRAETAGAATLAMIGYEYGM